MDRTHGSIGRAIYYTSVVVTFGFSILALSNFIPTVYFGLLTGLAMVLALINNLTLLALLILTFKPLGPPSGGVTGRPLKRKQYYLSASPHIRRWPTGNLVKIPT